MKQIDLKKLKEMSESLPRFPHLVPEATYSQAGSFSGILSPNVHITDGPPIYSLYSETRPSDGYISLQLKRGMLGAAVFNGNRPNIEVVGCLVQNFHHLELVAGRKACVKVMLHIPDPDQAVFVTGDPLQHLTITITTGYIFHMSSTGSQPAIYHKTTIYDRKLEGPGRDTILKPITQEEVELQDNFIIKPEVGGISILVHVSAAISATSGSESGLVSLNLTENMIGLLLCPPGGYEQELNPSPGGIQIKSITLTLAL